MTAATAAPSPFAVFRKREFSLLWLAQLVSTIGSSLTDLAAGILVFRLTGSALSVGLMLLASVLPTLVVGLVAGVFVDRYDRKRIMISADLIRFLLVATIPFAISINVALLYVVVALNSAVKQFFDPAEESVLPDIASEQELSAANSFLSISSFGSTAIGFAAAGLLASRFDIDWAFWIDSLTFLASAACITFVHVRPLDATESSSVGVVVENLREGLSYLWANRIVRSLFLVAVPVFFSFGLWNVLLLPFATRALKADEFQYGIQEGATSLGFVIGSLVMANYADRLREGAWLVIGFLGMGLVGILYGLTPTLFGGFGRDPAIAIAIGLVMLSGFLNAPSSIARRTALQRNVPREMRGRVFSAFFVARDLVSVLGILAAGLADIIWVGDLVVAASVLLVVSAVLVQALPALGQSRAEWRRAVTLLRTAPATAAAAYRALTPADLDRLIGRVPALGLLDDRRRAGLLATARIGEAEAGTTIVSQGDESSSAYFILDGELIAGTPSASGEFRSLSTMGPGDFFGEIAALTGSRRTANVVTAEPTTLVEVPAETLRSLMSVPQIGDLFLSTLQLRLARTATDLPRLAALDQRDLRELRTAAPSGSTAEALPKTYAS